MDPQALMDFLGFSTGEVERAALVLSRLTGLFLAAPFFSRSVGPMRVRLALMVAVAWVLFPLAPHWPGEGKGQAVAMSLAVINEVLLGATVGIITHWVLVATQTAGSLMGFEMSLSMAEVMDPTSGMREGVLSNMLYLAALMIYLIINGHHLLLEGLARSFKTLPLGVGLPRGDGLLATVAQGVSHMFVLAMMIAAPVVVASKLLYLGLGLINRASPQIQVFFVAMPIMQLVGFIIMGLGMTIFSDVLVREIEFFLELGFSIARR
ncbi:MAG: flagellar biosynthetic protein FliR [Magnetococcales bacterium]|nr:flagellar biosynthetic protein FliR [Magnetococcales bacterium]NGZ28765.1 flagellar biosynthetic protein FliR [Magnetococcales bacterium]